MSHLTIKPNDRVIEEFAEFVVKLIQQGANIDTKNEQQIIELFKKYLQDKEENPIKHL